MQDYEYRDEGDRYLCRLHHRLRCDECHYVSELQEQNKRYREALEFYADRDNYKPEHLDPETDEKWSKIDYDEGFNARKTLKKECTNGRYCQTNFR